MSNIKSEEVCENCKHFFNEHQTTDCRKYAPRGEGWARVQKMDWCSEFEKIPSRKKGHVVG